MNLFLIKAELKDAETIHTMQIKSVIDGVIKCHRI
ncbi:hypothetical protein SOV_49390 [Sporomusa ovata DSM 2662]|nr:hypothetical protein SOV_2c02080 [Sporomusa ovata DSM 2662]